jgi:hypothetical protein
MATKLTPPDRIRRFDDWIGVDECGQSDRRPDDPRPESKWAAFVDWLLGYSALDIQDSLERRFFPRRGRR